MKKLSFFVTAAFVAASAVPSFLSAQGISCTTGFGSVPTATFGGTDIPNNAVAYSNCRGDTGAPLFSLNLTAHQRYDNAALTNNGANVFTAQAGQDASTGGKAVVGYAKWNFAWQVMGGIGIPYTYKLFYDTDPAPATILSKFVGVAGGTGDSWNLGMPFTGGFDMNASGEYGFTLIAYNANNGVAASTSIRVNTISTVPEPSTYVLMAVGLVVVGAASRRRKTLA